MAYNPSLTKEDLLYIRSIQLKIEIATRRLDVLRKEYIRLGKIPNTYLRKEKIVRQIHGINHKIANYRRLAKEHRQVAMKERTWKKD